ncbi:MAG: GDP-mannose 4,6-dehydratase [Proteobacteria bacterium]|nr:GDP-mannose 4,6-dehydratase [Pseudomonadota bacterium]
MPVINKIIITGVAGLIGSHLADTVLEEFDCQLVGVDDLSAGRIENIQMHMNDSRFSFHQFDVCQARKLDHLCKDADIIVHLAARKKIGEKQSGVEVLSVNSRGLENVLESARKHGCKVVLGSTSDVYGLSQELPFREDGDLVLGPSTAKRWAYAVSKLYDEHLAMAYYKDHGVPVVILRYFGCFSPRSSFSWSGGHVPLFIDWILKDEEVIIHGDGSQTRSMGHVLDTVKGTALAMHQKEAVGEIINIGNDEELSVIDCARLIHRLAETQKPIKIKLIPMEELFGSYRDIPRRKPDLSKAARLLGYKPQLRFENALRETIAVRKRDLGIA